MKFKIGQKVKVISANIESDEFKSMIGKICEIKDFYTDNSCIHNDIAVYTPDKKDYWYFTESDLEAVPEEKTWDTLQVNDVLIDCNEYEKIVLGICGRIIFYSSPLDKDDASSFETKETMIKWGWKIKQDTPIEEINKDEKFDIEDIKKGLEKVLEKLKHFG